MAARGYSVVFVLIRPTSLVLKQLFFCILSVLTRLVRLISTGAEECFFWPPFMHSVYAPVLVLLFGRLSKIRRSWVRIPPWSEFFPAFVWAFLGLTFRWDNLGISQHCNSLLRKLLFFLGFVCFLTDDVIIICGNLSWSIGLLWKLPACWRESWKPGFPKRLKRNTSNMRRPDSALVVCKAVTAPAYINWASAHMKTRPQGSLRCLFACVFIQSLVKIIGVLWLHVSSVRKNSNVHLSFRSQWLRNIFR